MLMLASEAGNLEAVTQLLNLNFSINLKVEGKSAADLAWENQHQNVLLALLNANSLYPSSFEEEMSSINVKIFTQSIKCLFKLIREDFIKEIEEFLNNHPHLRYVFSTTNKSALSYSLELKKFHTYKLLLHNGLLIGQHEDINKITKDYTQKERDKVVEIFNENEKKLKDEEKENDVFKVEEEKEENYELKVEEEENDGFKIEEDENDEFEVISEDEHSDFEADYSESDETVGHKTFTESYQESFYQVENEKPTLLSNNDHAESITKSDQIKDIQSSKLNQSTERKQSEAENFEIIVEEDNDESTMIIQPLKSEDKYDISNEIFVDAPISKLNTLNERILKEVEPNSEYEKVLENRTDEKSSTSLSVTKEQKHQESGLNDFLGDRVRQAVTANDITYDERFDDQIQNHLTYKLKRVQKDKKVLKAEEVSQEIKIEPDFIKPIVKEEKIVEEEEMLKEEIIEEEEIHPLKNLKPIHIMEITEKNGEKEYFNSTLR